MTDLEAAVLEVAFLLEELSVPYMLIGGLAVGIWGEPRSTLDADFSLWVEPPDVERVVRRISDRLKLMPSDPLRFAMATRVLPAITLSGVRADLVLASLATERGLIARAKPTAIGPGKVMVVSVEDLIWMKLISERPKDIEDARRLLRRHAKSLDRAYLEPILEQLADSFARADILEIYQRP